jgi:hypothetical protein
MIDANKAFRDYATRVSFNMSLSRNQIWVLRTVMLDLEYAHLNFNERTKIGQAIRHTENGGERFHDTYVTGVRKLLSMGLVENTKEWIEDDQRCRMMESLGKQPIKRYWGPSLQFTPAGEHVIALLRIAGLIPNAAANDAKPAKKRRA